MIKPDVMDQSVIVTEGLTKWYGPVQALSDLSLAIRRGEVFGLVGPNGSGKTTMLRLLLGLLRPTSGRARVAGFDCWHRAVDVRRLVAYLPGELRLFGWMTGFGFLRFMCGLRDVSGLDRAAAIAEEVMRLDLGRKVRTYSTGMKQKLALALAFGEPVDILILDEPTSALDPSARGDVLNLVAEARRDGQTVIFSGHVLNEVQKVADRVGIMRLGRLMHVEDLHTRKANMRLVLARFDGEAPTTFPDELAVRVRENRGDTLLLEHFGAVGPLLAWLTSQPVVDLAIGVEDIQDIYNRYHGPNADLDESLEPAGAGA